MTEYMKMARKAHVLIGQKANLGNGEEDFYLKTVFIKSEAVEGLPAPTAGGASTGILADEGASEGASIVLAGEASSAELLPVAVVARGAMLQTSYVLTPSLVQSTPTPRKRPYQQ